MFTNEIFRKISGLVIPVYSYTEPQTFLIPVAIKKLPSDVIYILRTITANMSILLALITNSILYNPHF